MNFLEIKELIDLFETSSIRELDLKGMDIALFLSKNDQARTLKSETVAEPQPVVTTTQQVQPVEKIKQERIVEEKHAEGETINSPIVGVVYTANDPTGPPFKKVGDTVEVGETLCIVEAMKIMNDITSDVKGTITEILINNEEVVEFGQPLFRII